MRRMLAVLMAAVMALSLAAPAMAQDAPKSKDTVILYTNDVHTYIDGELSYDVIASLKDQLETQYEHVLLVDAGDHIQGTAYGSMDSGKTIIELMNAAGYDLATPGNHEFDYGVDGCMSAMEWADYPYVSCNFYHMEDGVRSGTVLQPYSLFDLGDETIAFVGITTPETLINVPPAYFQDENGNFIYDIAGGEDGRALYDSVQKAIDRAKEAGADMVIGLGHLGEAYSFTSWLSRSVIANTHGLSAMIDGHSHSTIEGRTETDKDGCPVLLTQTGEYFNRVGMMIIDDETHAITTHLLEKEDLAGLLPDADVKAIKDGWIGEIEHQLGQTIGFAQVTLDNYDAQGNRMVRLQETSSGDFAADALYHLFDEMELDVDFAIINGGGVRNRAISGEMDYFTCKEIHTFGNVACLQTITGAQLLDALEWGAKSAGVSENGGFLQVSGLTYKIDTSIPCTVQSDEKGAWIGGPTGEYRVHDVKVYNKETNVWEALDLKAEYNLAGYNYILRDLGDGFAMFDGAVNVLDYVMEDYMVLANYIRAFDGGVVSAANSPLSAKYPGFVVDYGTIGGSGRITMTSAEPAHSFTDLEKNAWYDDAVDYVLSNGLMNGVSGDRFDPHGTASRAQIAAILWRLEGEGTTNYAMPFRDVDQSAWYAEAVRWAAAQGILNGYSAETFGPNDPVTREQLAAILYRYAQSKGKGFTGSWMFLLDYADRAEISDWAYEAMCWMTMKGILNGTGSKMLEPRGSATRAQVAAMIQRFSEAQ